MSTNLKYPYNWGRNHVQTFVEKHARGTYFLARLLGVSPGDLRVQLTIVLCQGNSVRWESLKHVIKYLEDYSSDDMRRLSDRERYLILKYYKVLAENEVLDEKSYSEALDTLRSNFLSY